MHRMNPLNAAFVGYTSGGARGLVEAVEDSPMMQEMKGNFMKGEQREKIEAPQNYGFTSVVLPGKKGKDGQIEECAEAFISFLGGNRSFPVASVMDDRRHRPMGLKPGENAQYDDIGQMTLMRRNGLFMMSTDGEDADGKKAERMASLRHVTKQKQKRPTKAQQAARALLSFEQREAMALADKEEREKHKHEGEGVNTEVRCTANRIEFRAGDSVVGYYDKGEDTWYLKGKIVSMEVSQRFETVGKTYLGLDSKNEPVIPKVITEDGPAKQTWAKPGA